MKHSYQAESNICQNPVCGKIFYNNNRNGRHSDYCSIDCRKYGTYQKFLANKRLLTQIKRKYKQVSKYALLTFLEARTQDMK